MKNTLFGIKTRTNIKKTFLFQQFCGIYVCEKRVGVRILFGHAMRICAPFPKKLLPAPRSRRKAPPELSASFAAENAMRFALLLRVKAVLAAEPRDGKK